MSDTQRELEELFTEVSTDLGAEVRLAPPASSPAGDLPAPLREFYSFCDGGNVLFGEIYAQGQLPEMRTAQPFQPDWVPFGGRHTGEFWLCSIRPIVGLWFTSWDHESGAEVGEPVSSGLPDFLRDCYQMALEYRSGSHNYIVVEALPARALPKLVVETKRIMGVGTQEARGLLSSLPVELPIHNALEGKGAVDRFRALGVACRLRLEYF